MTKRVTSQRTKMDRKSAASLLYPIAISLKSGGLSEKEAEAVFQAAYARAVKALKGQRVEHIGDPAPYQDVIGLWMRDKRFLDEAGKPRPLSMSGKNGFASLVRQVRYKIDPKKMLSILLHYGNVRKVGQDKYSLAESFFNSFSRRNFAFEPHASFLLDASDTLGRMLTGSKKAMAHAPFWLRTCFKTCNSLKRSHIWDHGKASQ